MMLILDERQLSWFLTNLMQDYDILSEMYSLREEFASSPVHVKSINAEITETLERVKRYQAELSEYLDSKSADTSNLPEYYMARSLFAPGIYYAKADVDLMLNGNK